MAGFCVVRRRHLGMACRLLGFAAVLSVCGKVEASDVTWINDGGGTFSDEANWTPDLPFSSDVPDANDIAHFGLTTSSIGLPKTYTVSFDTDPTNQQLVVEDDRVTFDLNGHTYTATSPIAVVLATESGRQGRVAVMDGFLSTPFQADIEIGSVAGSSGTLQVLTGGLVLGSPEIFVGVNGGGTLSIFNNGDVIADAVTLGKNAGSTGTATITGGGSSLLADGLIVGEGGHGVLNITSGGRVNNTGASIGSLGVSGSISSGEVTVSGPGSQWVNSDSLAVGYAGIGALSITDGGRVQSNRFASLGELDGAGTGGAAMVTIDGANSQWIHTGDLDIGRRRAGTLTITAGGKLETANAYIGRFSGANGSAVAVSGVSSLWMNSGLLTVGGSGSGTLSITAGGRVQTTADGTIGGFETGVAGNGEVTVSGDGSQWNVGRLFVGYAGNGTLSITGGGYVGSTGASSLGEVDGAGTGGAAMVTIDGANSQWIHTGDLDIGRRRAGTLTISGGGRVESASANIGSLSGSNGSAVTVSDAGSLWMNSEFLIVGSEGSGALTVTAGGRVESGDLIVGYAVQGALSITDGGSVQSTGFSSLGEIDGSDASSVMVDGANSQWSHTGTLYVGRRSPATLTISGGARVESGSSSIATNFGTDGSAVTVSGTSLAGVGSTWDIDGPLGIGGDADAQVNGGIGTLTIQSGGTVSVAQHTIVFADDELRLAGGTFSSPDISIRSGGTFLWTAGTLHAGIFRESLVVPSGGILAPGNSAGSTEVFIDYSQLAGGVLQIEIGGVSQTQFDRVIVTGDAFLGGDLQLALLDNFLPSPTSMFTIFDARAISGTFANVASGQRLMTSDGLGSFLVNYGNSSPFDPTQIVLSAFLPTVGLPGDYNQNGTVDAADYTVWRDNFGSGTALPNDDTTGVGPDDYTRWKTNFGQTAGSSAGAAAPEPTTLVLIAFGAMVWITRRRARSAL